MATVRETSHLDAPADVVWDRLQRIDLLQEVAWPLLVQSVPPGTADRWQVDVPVPLASKLLGVVPMGTQTVRFTEIDHERLVARTAESGGSVESWEHEMSVTDHGDGTCTYTDHVEIEAGQATGAIGWFARQLYAHRHRRWRRLAPLLAG